MDYNKDDLLELHLISGDGSSIETAFVFDADYSEDETIDLEYNALSELFGYEPNDFVKQQFVPKNGKFYDEIMFNEYRCKDFEKLDFERVQKVVYFDISHLFTVDK